MGLFDKMMSSVKDGINGVMNAGSSASLQGEWKADRRIVLRDPAPETLDELKSAVDVSDPGSVAAYFVYGVMALTADYDTGMGMMKYLFADLEPFGRGFTEGGVSGRAGWDT
ncbi:MAG: hypothetical protein II745_07765, partial [Lachnospiraceae bacterium]|nr:hypothetical protein [Lachnospiraceae bacterium]